jgi:hypothetical protein
MHSVGAPDLTVYVESTMRVMSSSNSSASNGNQIKWINEDGLYIKLDCLGYEAVSERLVTDLLTYTDLNPKEYVSYTICEIVEDGKWLGLGCLSRDFRADAEEVSVAQLLKKGFKSFAINYDELREYLFPIVKFDVKQYIDKILCVDAITKNDDRHFGNISFLYKDGIYTPAPIFDNGSACMSDILTYPMSQPIDVNYQSIKAKPFSTDFKRQLHDPRKILIARDKFLSSIRVEGEYAKRALTVLEKSLEEMEGLAWEEI